jgi:hypothetical protein
MTISNEKQVDVALKYLELARAEILYRVKSSNDTLIVYAGAVGAIAAWAYKSYHDAQPGSLPNGPALSIPPSLLSAGLVVSFLALVASWIVFHNERMVKSLAEYQRDELSSHLDAAGSKPWECSLSLCRGDSRPLSLVTSVVYGAMVVGPSAVALYEMWSDRGSFQSPGLYLVMSAIMSFCALVFMLVMVVDRWQLRGKIDCPKIPDGHSPAKTKKSAEHGISQPTSPSPPVPRS